MEGDVRWTFVCRLLDEIIFAEEFALARVALLVEQTSTGGATHAFGMPQAIENVGYRGRVHGLRAAETLAENRWRHTETDGCQQCAK